MSLKEIQETESTVLYHIYQAAQLDHSRLKDFISSLKKVTNAPEYILDPFLMAVLLSVSNVYEDQVIEILQMRSSSSSVAVPEFFIYSIKAIFTGKF